jgi:predicted ArsR family transcriptional regulator
VSSDLELAGRADDPSIRAVAALEDELRRGMYAFIRAARRPVTRDEAAASVGISRKLAAFHLDKLVEAGVLSARYQAAGVRKVGRAPKVYEPSGLDIRISIPPRQHDLLAEVLLGGVLGDSVLAAADRRGREAGAAERERVRPGRLGAERGLTLASGVLARHGFEPARETPTCVRLRNCPFHPLAEQATDLICGLNHAFLGGLVAGLEADAVQAVLDPRPGECCVELRSA